MDLGRKRNREEEEEDRAPPPPAGRGPLHSRSNTNAQNNNSLGSPKGSAGNRRTPLPAPGTDGAPRGKRPSARGSTASSVSSSSMLSTRPATTRAAAAPASGGGVFARLNGPRGPPATKSSAVPSGKPLNQPQGTHHKPESQTDTPPEDPRPALWAAKRATLEEELKRLAATHQRLRADKEVLLDVVEAVLREQELNEQEVQDAMSAAAAQHETSRKAIAQQEDACLARKQRALTEVARLQERVKELAGLKESTQEAILLETERTEELERTWGAAVDSVKDQEARLAAMKEEEERMKDASYGLSGEVRDMVVAMEQLQQQKQRADVAAMETEITRRELYSKCEELKGSIRVYCRVKGNHKPQSPRPATTGTTTTTTTAANEEAEEEGNATTIITSSGGSKEDDAEGKSSPATPRKELLDGADMLSPTPAVSPSQDGPAKDPPRDSTVSTASTTTSARCRVRGARKGRAGGGSTSSSTAHSLFTCGGTTAGSLSARGSEVGSPIAPTDGCCRAEDIYSFPDGAIRRKMPDSGDKEGDGDRDDDEYALPRTIVVHQSRQNATSTGRHNTTDSFSFDYVFDHHATQAEVYTEVEPLVNSAIDGYRVCIFAYGQTGSGKTYTMEGSLATDDGHGIIPRALATIFARQEILAKEGWSYTLSCSLVEIYNDVIHDLQQSPSTYEGTNNSSASPSSSSYHTIKHQGENTTITNVKSTKLSSMEDFRRVYKLATQHRRTARTQLNERSSRSHCIFTLHIDGVNSTIRQRSAGVLCLVDLAGSERVNESGVQGQQFKEAVNINKSLLDLGKCIHAMRCGTVAPWRNSKLTYLLQNYLGAKGGKMLMVVNVSDRRQHLPESINSLRFATRVSETVVGQSVKRVTSF